MPTVVHLCFGYAAVVPTEKPAGYSFLPQLADSTADQISIEAAQPKLDLGILQGPFRQDHRARRHRSRRRDGRDAATWWRGRIRAALKFIDAKRLVPAPDCGMKYLSRDAAFGKLKALSEGAAIVRKEIQ